MLINDDFRNHLPFDPNATVISDPPYNQKYHYTTYADDMEAAEYMQLLRSAFNGNRSVIVAYPEATINILPRVMWYNQCEETVSWVYNSNTAKQHRTISWWNCKPDFKKVGQDYKNPTDKRIAQRIAEGKRAKLYDWWNINQVKNVSKKSNPHPCPIPYEVAERMVLLTTNEGDLVVDPFAGSGTVLLAAKNNNRRYLEFEIVKEYYDYAKGLGL